MSSMAYFKRHIDEHLREWKDVNLDYPIACHQAILHQTELIIFG